MRGVTDSSYQVQSTISAFTKPNLRQTSTKRGWSDGEEVVKSVGVWGDVEGA